MLELVVPNALSDHSMLEDDAVSLIREMVGRRVYAFTGALEEACDRAAALSDDSDGPPVLVNHITEQTPKTRVVDVYMYRNGRQMSVSSGVEKPPPDDA